MLGVSSKVICVSNLLKKNIYKSSTVFRSNSLLSFSKWIPKSNSVRNYCISQDNSTSKENEIDPQSKFSKIDPYKESIPKVPLILSTITLIPFISTAIIPFAFPIEFVLWKKKIFKNAILFSV